MRFHLVRHKASKPAKKGVHELSFKNSVMLALMLRFSIPSGIVQLRGASGWNS